MKTMSDDLFQRPKKKEDDTSSGTSQNTQKINEMDLFGDVEKRKHSTEPEKSTIEEQLQNYSNNSEDAFSMDDDLSSLFNHEESSDNATKARAAEENHTGGLEAKDKREIKSADAFNMDNDLSSLFNREINSNETTKEDKDSVDEALDKKAPKQIDLYVDIKDKHVQGYEIPNTQDSYTAALNCNGYVYLINCADNLDEEAVQQTIGDRDPEALFLISDATKFANIEANKVYVTSKFYGDYYSNGEFFEDEIGLPNGKVELQLKNDVLRVHYVKNGDSFSVHFSNGKPKDNCDVLINSTTKDESALAKKTYLDNNNTKDYNLKDYDEITVDLVNKKVYAD